MITWCAKKLAGLFKWHTNDIVWSSGVGGGVQGTQAEPKSFYLSKIREKSLEIWAKALKIQAKMVLSVVWLHKIAPNVCRKYMKTFFLEVTPKWWSLWEKICRQKPNKNLLGTLGKSGKNPSNPQNFFAPTAPMVWSKRRLLCSRCSTQLPFAWTALQLISGDFALAH